MTMRMKNPPHPGGLVRENIDSLGLSVAEAAEGVGVTRQQLHRVIKGEHGVTPEMAVRLEAIRRFRGFLAADANEL